MRCRCLVHLTPLLSLGIVHRDATLAALDEDNKCDDNNRKCQNTEQNKNVKFTLARLFERLADRLWQSGHNACKDKQ